MKKLLIATALLTAPLAAHAQPTTNSPGTYAGILGWNGSMWQGVPLPQSASTMSSGSVAVANTFQTALAANSARKGCTIQNTSNALEYVEPISTGSALEASAFQLSPGASFNCDTPGATKTDNIAITSATVGATYVAAAQ